MFVQQKAAIYEQHIFKKSKASSEKTMQSYAQFNNAEQDMLDDLIINCFPETFMAFVQMQASESKDMVKSQKLMAKVTKMRQASNQNDKMFLLREIRQFIKLH